MGQKVHPFGYRLGVIYDWRSRWFFLNKKEYKENLLVDIKIREFLMSNYYYANLVDVEIERGINSIKLILHAVKPGMIIGKGGKGLEELSQKVIRIIEKTTKQRFTKKTMPKIDIKIEQVKKPYLNAYYVAQIIAERLVKNFPHRATVHFAIDRVMEAGAKGVRVKLAGRINGEMIARSEKFSEGNVPTSTIRERINYAEYPALLPRSGYVGIKVWIAE
ncbi:MAG: 30S ribosomal protein S3 [Patescibacteria group bacterium]|nr:MAG: 30S ribosomal protein S3 [Patescibacteria group bacterium]